MNPPATLTPLSAIGQAIADAITVVPCYPVPPGDVAHLPCAVLGPPSLSEMSPSLGAYWTVTFQVKVIGRSYDMDEVHTQLNDLLYLVVVDLVRQAGAAGQLRVTETEPGTTTVGGHDQPDHTITVVAQTMYYPE